MSNTTELDIADLKFVTGGLEAALPRFRESLCLLGRLSRGEALTQAQASAAVYRLAEILGIPSHAIPRYRAILEAQIRVKD